MSDTAEKPNYKQSLNLPQTSFPMEAKLVQNEPKRLAAWTAADLYKQVQARHSGDPLWVLHDGPPFANGDIHIGHVINKTLKDVIVRFKTMQGHRTPYVPGWDCHGLPIEHKIQEQAKKAGERIHELSTLEIRRRCHEYAQKYVDVQAEQFKRLGILGDWANPYLTMRPAYEASTLEVFAKFVEAGLVYRKLKPVPWSIANQTALADAELEYQDVDDNSVYVEFELLPPSPGTPGEGRGEGASNDKLRGEAKSSVGRNHPHPNPLPEYWERGPEFLLIWTTTPWTLPANLAVAVGSDVTYAKVKYGDRVGIVAADLVEKVFALAGKPYEVVGTVLGSDLAGLTYRHPFTEHVGRVVMADYVTTTDGTGLVHTAPGHGEDDYETGLREGLEVYSPVLATGRYDDTAPDWLRGKTVWEANKLIPQRLKDDGLLFAGQMIRHSYPHDWRSKTPIIFRATEQWFVAMDKDFTPSPGTPGEGGGEGDSSDSSRGEATPSDARSHPHPSPLPEYREREQSLRDRAMSAVDHVVDFVPAWGRARLTGMLSGRPDWCVSRQRAWGLPIPVFYNEQGQPLLTPESVRAVAKRVGEAGSDVWFTESPGDLLGKDFVYPPGFTPDNLRKEKDIFDVWFESGNSWAGVLRARSDLHFPADLYLEGSDQHRGWFQLSLLPALGATGRPPFKQVLTHGFVVKPDGTKVSKSDKEYVTATTEINTHGADLLRLWTCSVDYQNDIPASPKTVKEFGDKYRKIRNTLRYLLSNLYDFDAASMSVEVPADSLDGWAVDQLDQLIVDVTAAYDGYQLHRAFRLLHDFCSVQVSSVYGNAMKDRLYCDLPNAALRRRCQTVMHRTVIAVTKLLAPMIVFTADEAWGAITNRPAGEADLSSVHLASLPKASGQMVTEQTREDWKTLMELRSTALGQLDELKKASGLNKAGEAEVAFTLPEQFAAYGVDLEDLVGCGHYTITPGPAATVKVLDAREKHKACARCWKRRPTVVDDLCDRCVAAVGV